MKSQAEAQLDTLISSLRNQKNFDPSNILTYIAQVRKLVADVNTDNLVTLGRWVEALKKAPARGYDYQELTDRAHYTYLTRQEYVYGALLLLPVNEAFPELASYGPLPGYPLRPLVTLETYCTQSVPASEEMLQLAGELDPSLIRKKPDMCSDLKQ